jgi:argininosuccinate lyase
MADKLWQRDRATAEPDERVEEFTVGDDHLIDLHILADDCWASIAHAAALEKAGILNASELEEVQRALLELIERHSAGEVTIDRSQEDCHTAIEQTLTEQLGDLGKKIHTGRSRNDQVLTALRLLARRRILDVASALHALAARLLERAEASTRIAIRGTSHSRPAMPTTLAIYLGSYVESLLDDAILLRTAAVLNDRSPLGSAAGFGSSIELDRDYTRELLAFEELQLNALYCQNSRGKVEGTILHALTAIQGTLARLAVDLIQFSSPELGFVILPDDMTTGSSIMPQKKNPDVCELVRARAAVVAGAAAQVHAVTAGLGSGYHRDYQLLKEPLISALATVEESLEMMDRLVAGLNVDDAACAASCTREIYAADLALDRARQGIPFRDAYREAMAELEGLSIDGDFVTGRIDSYQSLGSMGNPGLDSYQERITELGAWIETGRKRSASMIERLSRPLSP